MSQFLIDFVTYFGLNALDSPNLTVGMTLGIIITSYAGLMLTMCGIRCIFELIKIITDRSNF